MEENQVAHETIVQEEKEEETQNPIEMLSFEDWLKRSSFHENEQVLPNVNEMSIEEIVKHYQEAYEVPDNWLSIAYTNLETNEKYHHREDETIVAASTTKVLVAMVYQNLIENNEISLETPIPYNPSMYQPGAGEMTKDIEAGIGKESYPLEEVIEDLLVPSGNIPRQMLVAYYERHFGSLAIEMEQLLQNVDYPAELFEENQISAKVLEEALLILVENEMYKPTLERMRLADENRYFKFYIEEDMPVKHGQLDELRHQIGIYEIDETPIYTLVFLTSHLYDDVGDAFLGGVNLQLAVQAEYQYYIDHFDGEIKKTR